MPYFAPVQVAPRLMHPDSRLWHEAELRSLMREEIRKALANPEAPSELDAAPRDSMFNPL